MAEEVYEHVSEGRGRGGGSRAGMELEAEVRLVSVLTLHLARVGLAQVSGDKGSSLMIEASSLATSLAEDQDYQQFQFSRRPVNTRLGRRLSSCSLLDIAL